MFSLQQRIQTPHSAFISCCWLSSQTIACGSLEGELVLLQNSPSSNQFTQHQTIEATHKKASLISLHPFTASPSALLSTSFDGAVRVWASHEDQWDLKISNEEFVPVDLMTTACNGAGMFVCARTDGSVGIYSDKGQEKASISNSSQLQEVGALSNCATGSRNCPITALSLPSATAARQQLAIGKNNGIVLLADLTSQRTLQTLNGHEGRRVQALSTSPQNSSILLSGAQDGLVCLWDGRAGCLAASFAFESGAGADKVWISKVQFNPAAPESFFLATSASGAVKYWDLRAGAVAHSWESVGGLAEVAPAGDKVCVVGEREVCLYRVPN